MKKIRHPCRTSLAAALCLGLAAGSALADGQWVSGPSALSVGESGVFSTGGYAPGAIVTLRVTLPSGQSTSAAYAVEADGIVSQVVLPDSEGIYKIEVLDTDGKVVAATNLAASR